MIIRGETNIVKAYDLTSFVDLDKYDLDNEKDIDNFKNVIESYITSGEAEALEFETGLVGMIPENTEIEIKGNTYLFEDLNYINVNVNKLITEKLNKGDIICILQAKGEGYFEYEENPISINDLQVGYIACDINTPKNPFYMFLCDLILPDLINLKNKKLNIIANNFYPKDTIVAEVYIVKEEEKNKILNRICEIDMLHFGWDKFEDIIQV